MSFQAIVRHYEQRFRPLAQRELSWFRSQPNLAMAIQKAALARDAEGKRYSHQWRRREEDLEAAAARLSACARALSEAESFAALHREIEQTLRPISDLGPLYKYDTALRIGAYLGLLPEVVYLHSGTAEGARALGFNPKAKFLLVRELPMMLHQLAPHELEDVLWIYKDHLAAARDGNPFTLPDDTRCFVDEDVE